MTTNRFEVMTSNSTSTIVVTGASSGIGRATALELARSGHHVYAAARRERELRALSETNPGITALRVDVTDPASVVAARDRVRIDTAGGGPDVLVNAAGVATLGPVEATPIGQVRRQFDVNVLGALAVTQSFLPDMPARRAGRIVNISSVLGRFTLPWHRRLRSHQVRPRGHLGRAARRAGTLRHRRCARRARACRYRPVRAFDRIPGLHRHQRRVPQAVHRGRRPFGQALERRRSRPGGHADCGASGDRDASPGPLHPRRPQQHQRQGPDQCAHSRGRQDQGSADGTGPYGRGNDMTHVTNPER
jgi:NAD(P)-dependent dehydrogenase (short-subunit alcohol dehydrogenase family)